MVAPQEFRHLAKTVAGPLLRQAGYVHDDRDEGRSFRTLYARPDRALMIAWNEQEPRLSCILFVAPFSVVGIDDGIVHAIHRKQELAIDDVLFGLPDNDDLQVGYSPNLEKMRRAINTLMSGIKHSLPIVLKNDPIDWDDVAGAAT